jgi:hypothetical protein
VVIFQAIFLFSSYLDKVNTAGLIPRHFAEVSLATFLLCMMGEVPWPQIRVRNKQHCDAAVVIIGGGISGEFQTHHNLKDIRYDENMETDIGE